jgi:hypothetical protein
MGGIHLMISLAAAAIASLLVFVVWYPAPFAVIAGGTTLFVILITVDVVLGPALTAVVASNNKRRSELGRDLIVIATVQICAFAYGLYSVAMARPVAIAFELDLFRVVSAADVDSESLEKAPSGLRSLSWSGPRLLAAVKPTQPEEYLRSVDLGLAGVPLAALPVSWRDYDSQRAKAWNTAKPVTMLLDRYPKAIEAVLKVAAANGQDPKNLRFLPVLSRQNSWSAVLAGPDSRIIGFLPYDGFL